jgi:hypothetical protein
MAISYRKLINEKCKQCTYDPMSGLGNWRQQIGLCTVKSCPLWAVRPQSKPQRKEGVPEAQEGEK